MPYKGGKITGPFGGGNLGLVLSSDATIAFWVAKNGCEPTKTTKEIAGDQDTKIKIETYTQCQSGATVERITVENGGHTWPGGWQYLGRWIIGRTTHAINASEEVWRFLSSHHL